MSEQREANERRLAWLVAAERGDDDAPRTGPPDAITAAALALADVYGWWYDPVLSPEQVLEMAEVVAEALAAWERS